MTRLAQANRILYVEPWAYLRPILRRLRMGDVRKEEWLGQRLTEVRPQLHVFRPPLWIPRADGSWVERLTLALFVRMLRRILGQLGFRNPILWLFLPDMGVFVGRFGEKLVIYHVVDEYAAYSGMTARWRPVVEHMEEELARQADLVFVTSPMLMASKARFSERVTLVPNAVDYKTFAAVRDSGAPIPADVDSGSRPVIGYIGAINDKVDLPLLAQVARHYPDWVLLLVGPVLLTDPESLTALTALRGLPNVRLVGRQDVTDVPRYIMACDVCLLPYRVNDWTRHIDSLKIYEYLACGKPVVASQVPTAQCCGDLIAIAPSADEFVEMIGQARTADTLILRKKRQELAERNTWDERVELLSAAISQRLREKHKSSVLLQGEWSG